MQLFIIIQLLIILIVFFVVNLMKHWQLMLMPDVLKSLDVHIQTSDVWLYTLISYLSYFYGNLCGQVAWHWLTDKMSTTAALGISLLFMSLFTYLQGMSSSLNGFFVFRFLLGMSMNLEKSGKAFIHEKISKSYRQPAFFMDSAAYTLGTLSGPIVGLSLFHFKPDFAGVCKAMALLIAACALLHYTMFSAVEKDDSATVKRATRVSVFDEERIPFLKRGTIVNLNWRNALIHAVWDNKIARSLIIISLVNATGFHLQLVLTTLFLNEKRDPTHHKLDMDILSQGNLLGGLASLVTIAYISSVVRRPVFYKRYMKFTIILNSFFCMLMPFLKVIIVSLPIDEQYFIWVFFMMKEACCYYLYSQILAYLISVSTFKLFRKPLNFALTMLKSLLHGGSFNIILPMLYFGKHNSPATDSVQYDYTFVFWLIAICQLLTLTQFKYIDVVLDKSNMID